MNRVYVAGYFLLGLFIVELTLFFSISQFEDIIQFYSIMIDVGVAYSVLMIGLASYTSKTTLVDLRTTDSLTGSFLGTAALLLANFLFSYGYSLIYTAIYGAAPLTLLGLGLVSLQISPFLIVSNIMIHAFIIAPCEELAFREVLPQALFHVFKRLLPENYAVAFAYIIASVSYFGIAHLVSTGFNIILMGFIITSAIILAIIRVKFGLLSCVASHTVNNLASLVF
jgi:membrane protease YdiL (CAAX protease family)